MGQYFIRRYIELLYYITLYIGNIYGGFLFNGLTLMFRFGHFIRIDDSYRTLCNSDYMSTLRNDFILPWVIKLPLLKILTEFLSGIDSRHVNKCGEFIELREYWSQMIAYDERNHFRLNLT